MSTLKKFLYLFSLYGLLNSVSPARILAHYPVPFHSHQSVFTKLTEELAKQGHELVVLAPNPHSKPIENVTQIDVTEVSYRMWGEGYEKRNIENTKFAPGPVEMFAFARQIFPEIVSAQISVPEMQAIIRDKTQHFDVILAESCLPSSLILAARFKAPIIQVGSLMGDESNYRGIGAVTHPLMFPDFWQKTVKRTFWDKIYELKTYFMLLYVHWKSNEMDNSIIRRHFGDDAPTIAELNKNVQMLILNAHHIWDNNRPVPPSVVYMGALHLKPPKPIPKGLQAYLDSSKNGVIYMSLGSKIQFSDLPAGTLRVFLKVFGSLPYDVLIKWNGGELPGKPANVRLEKWLPQNDMLHHPKIKGFITQGGLQSIDEAIAAKVPMIGCPVFADQWYNAEKLVHLGIGQSLELNNLEENNIREVIKAITEDKSYQENIARLSRIMEEQRAGGLQKALYWIDYVAKHGALHLRSPLADATLVDYFLLDVLGAIAIISIIIGIFILVVVKIVVRYIVSNLSTTSKVKAS